MRGRAGSASSLLSRTAAGVALVALVTLACLRVPGINATTAGFAYLMVVLAVAAGWGFRESLVVSVVAVLTFNFFFFHPVGTFTVADPQNWIALFTFLVTAIVASHLSERVRQQTNEARERQRETEQLYAFSRRILLMGDTKAVGPQMAQQIAQSFDFPAVALYTVASGEVFRGGADALGDIEPVLRQVAREGAPVSDRAQQCTVAPIALGGIVVGSLALKGQAGPDGVLQALVNLVAIALERERSTEIAAKAKIERQSEQFKSTLLDAVAHEFKTPLTSLKAAATSLIGTVPPLSGGIRELANIINEESDRMTRLVNEAIQIAQIEAGRIQIRKEPVAMDRFLREVLSRFESEARGRTIRIQVADNLPMILIDRDLVSVALGQLVNNALKYSQPDTPIEVCCDASNGTVEIRVHNAGPGIPLSERKRIFEKYYRRPASTGQSGSGLGLFVAREIMRAHGGDLRLEEGTMPGVEFWMSFSADSRNEPGRARA